MPERSLVRKGNRQYNKGNYEQAISRYEQALQAVAGQFEATYDLGNALYKAERFDRAEQTMQQAAADSLRTDDERAEAFYNLGNAQFKQQKYKEALESYKQSLRLNPSDMETKYNYAYTKRLIDDNEDGGGGGDDKNQDKDQNQDQQQQGNGQDKQDGDQQQDDKGQKGDDQEQQGGDPRSSRATGSRILRSRTRRAKATRRGSSSPFRRVSPRRSRNRCSMPSRPRKTARRTS